ncbi:MAG: vitamin K epoxide reductase family protein [Chitinophagaceae bacterium]
MKDNTIELLRLWLTKANYRIDNRQLRLQFLSHPNAPGVTAITDSLTALSIPNMAVEIPFSELHHLDQSFFAYIRQGHEEQFALVQQKDKERWEVKMNVDGSIIISSQKFRELFTGLAVVIEKNTAATPLHIARASSSYIFLGIAALACMIALVPDLLAMSHFLLAMAGVFTSLLIAAKELGFNTGRFEKFCSLSATAYCSAVLQSKYSKIPGNIKLYDLSLIFFSFQTFTWLFLHQLQGGAAYYLYFISLGGVPVIAGSLYLQKFVLKTWCPLCLAICGILAAQSIIAMPAIVNNTGFAFSASLILEMLTALVLLWLSWQFIKKQLEKNSAHENLEIQLLSFRRNYRLFMAYYKQLPELDTAMPGVPEIKLGAGNGPVNIVLVSNPLCTSCIALHAQLNKWIIDYPEISVSLRFYVPVETANDKRTLIAAKLLELYINDPQKGAEELDQWYHRPDPDAFYERHSRMHSADALGALKQQRKWCLSQNIFITPSLIINGKKFPVFYEPEDIGFFLEELIRVERSKIKHTVHESKAFNTVLS